GLEKTILTGTFTLSWQPPPPLAPPARGKEAGAYPAIKAEPNIFDPIHRAGFSKRKKTYV
ncbi:MAG: hypothetical protein JW932_19385, partial [Deltaproteobacteria bacterium]|nr:hypothetical protein [Deltaproteobacteria bacterium]